MRYIKHLSIPLVALAFFACQDPKQNHPETPSGESYPSFASDGAWCWFSDPRAIYHEGKHQRTYSGWVDSAGNVVVGFYDHTNKESGKHVLHKQFEKDDHDNPSFFMDADGKLMVFYSKHATGNSPIFLARAQKSEDIFEWEPVQELRVNDTIAYSGFSNTYTYTNIVQLKAEQNKLFLFWRGADFKPNVSTSNDGGRTWDEGRILVLPERIYKNRRPYMKVASKNESTIHFAFTDGHPNAEPTNSVYYMKYQDGALYRADGQKMLDWHDLPVDPAKADKVYDATKSKAKAWIWDVAENEDGNPVVVYATFPSDTNHVYHYGIYDGTQWNSHRLLDAGSWFPHTPEGAKERESYYSGGLVLDHNDPSHLFLAREKDGVFEIEHWNTPDKGKTWKVEAVTANSKFDNVRPFVVRNHPADSAIVMWMNVQKYVHYTNYRGAVKIRH